MRSGCPIKIVKGGIEIGTNGITAWLINNDIYRFNLWEEKEPPMAVPVPKQVKPWSSRPRALVAANPIDRPIVSPTPVKRPRSVSYELDTTISSASSCDSDSDSYSDSGTSRTESSSSSVDDGPRKKRKPNKETMAYYHRCLGHAGDVELLSDYGIDLSKPVSDKAPCISCVIKKIQ